MRVKRLEIQGFKSFKDKTVIHFDQGITGIVGPNGCGKSNIVDAFFWVMGEQSYKHMRGSSSDDLIFNGSSGYQPLGMAEVTLVLEHDVVDLENGPSGASADDQPVTTRRKEISVTRRVYRDGQGEYFINGAPSRLKDIHELFMDTGVGAKGYSVIEQGQIGKIVNSKPEERRTLIEEAAGIAKYKARKRESLRKMDAANENLARLNDVIAEIERSMNSLERQAHKARQYKKFKEELQSQEMTWGRRRDKVLKQRQDEILARRNIFEQELVGLKAELQAVETQLEADRVAQLAETHASDALQSTLQKLSDELTHERSALDLSRQRQGDLATQLEGLGVERTNLESTLVSERARLEGFESEVASAQARLEDARTRVQASDETVRAARSAVEESRQQIDQRKRALMSEISEASELQSRAARLSAKADALSEQLHRMSEALASNETERSQIETERAERHEKLSLTDQGCKDAKTRREQAESDRKQALGERESARNERDHAHRAFTEASTRLEHLKELERTRAGFGDGAKAILSWAEGSISASQGAQSWRAVADLIEVDSGFESAVEGWLDDRLEHLITQSPRSALEAVSVLRDSASGKVAIFCEQVSAFSETIASASSEAQDKLRQGGFEVLGPLLERVRIRPEASSAARNFIRSLFAGVTLVESVAPLREAGSSAVPTSIVARDGTVVDPIGVIRAGQSESSSMSVLQMKRQISDAESALAVESERLSRVEASLAAAEARIQACDQAVESAISTLQALELEHTRLVSEQKSSERALNEISARIARLSAERGQLEQTANESRVEAQAAVEQAQSLLERRASAEESITILEQELSVRTQALDAADQVAQRERLEETSVRERSASLARELEGLRGLIEERTKRLGEIARLVERASQEHAQFVGGQADMERKIEELMAAISQERDQLSQTRDRLERITAQTSSAMERMKALHQGVEAKGAELNQFAVELERIAADHAHLVQTLEEKYGPGCLAAPPVVAEQENFENPVVTTEMTAEEERLLAEQVEQLREKIRRLGEVNVMAVEEFEEVKKRHDHLAAERQDLVQSIENLNAAIEYINQTSEDRFRKAFDAIAERFERLFPIIFGGGQAKLSLVFPEGSTDILEAGVDILAQPPGKKIANITLLSGGEKALTAISLIFAIFIVKPSPFCVLDEVDAPLDDANIGKFNALLREMAAKSQFIVITHNKKTMELNDALFGVTMEEPGVSKMVSIQLGA